MAKQFFLIAPVLALCAFLLLGCQSQNTVVDAVPPPNLNGPQILQAPAPVRMASVMPPYIPAHRSSSLRSQWGIPASWIPDADAPPRPWKWIVIHHSASPTGSAAMFDKEHREKGWDELGYHFVIGNGSLTGDGQVEVGPRWPIQKHGAHAKTPDNRYNDFGIGICLVGNFQETRPTPAQMRSLAKLVAYLMQTYHIPPSCVIRHGDTKPTECPGRNLNILLVRRMAEQMLVAAGQDDPAKMDTASAAAPSELLQDVSGQ
jgi:hypothetical protein